MININVKYFININNIINLNENILISKTIKINQYQQLRITLNSLLINHINKY